MSRYIDAEKLVAEFKRLKLGEHSLIETVFANGVYAVIGTFPTADVEEVRHGKIIKTGRVYPYCSECNADLQSESYRYCPWCGAKLDKEKEI